MNKFDFSLLLVQAASLSDQEWEDLKSARDILRARKKGKKADKKKAAAPATT
jgi:hypothetical protein